MGAAVEHRAQRAVGPAQQQHRLAGDVGGQVVAGLGQLALVADVLPCPAEQPPAFQGEEGVVQVHRAMHAGAIEQLVGR